MKSFHQVCRYVKCWVSGALISVATPIAVTAGEKTVPTSPAGAIQPMATDNLLQTGLGLFVVLALIVAVAWVVRRMGRFQCGSGNSLRIIGGLSMGTRERVVLIQVGDTQLLVGVAPGRVQTLHVLPEAVQPGTAQTASESPFANSLSTLLNRRRTA